MASGSEAMYVRGGYTARQWFKRNLVASGSEAMYCERRLYSEAMIQEKPSALRQWGHVLWEEVIQRGNDSRET